VSNEPTPAAKAQGPGAMAYVLTLVFGEQMAHACAIACLSQLPPNNPLIES